MMTFNLLDQPWLPVRWANGDQPSEVGLREALLRAHEIAELATDNPLETLALNRLLAALVAAVYPTAREKEAWWPLWQQGHFDAAACAKYLDEFAAHFDLLSPTRPFFGHLDTEAKEVSPLTRLLHAATSGNNAVLFSHDLDSQPQPMTLAAAARAVVCAQAAALGGGIAKPFNFCHAPLVGGAFFWLRGAAGGQPSLFRALLLNLAPLAEVWGAATDDHPSWEAKKPLTASKRQVSGIRELFTFQSRRLQLVVSADGQVEGVRYNQGSKVEELLFHDPHLAYRSGKDGEFPLRFQAGRALWRDSTSYLMHRGSDSGGHAPRTLEWLTKSTLRQLGLDSAAALAVDVFGLVNDQAKVEMWRQERMMLYPSIVEDASRWLTLRELLRHDADAQMDDAHKRAGRLREATRAFASRVRLHKPWGIRLGDVERADRDAFAQMLDTDARYWLRLSQKFDAFLGRIATVPIAQLEEVRRDWQKLIRQAAREALLEAITALAQDATSWQALAEAETVLRYGTLYPKFAKTTQEESV